MKYGGRALPSQGIFDEAMAFLDACEPEHLKSPNIKPHTAITIAHHLCPGWIAPLGAFTANFYVFFSYTQVHREYREPEEGRAGERKKRSVLQSGRLW